MQSRTFVSNEGLFFTRNEDESVTIIKTSDEGEPNSDGSNIAFTQTIPEGVWCSAVLTMTAFDERPGDWAAFMAHHKGRVDLIPGRMVACARHEVAFLLDEVCPVERDVQP